MVARLARRLRRIHDNLAYRTWCSPDTGIVGWCDPEPHDPYQHIALGQKPRCRTCRRETR